MAAVPSVLLTVGYNPEMPELLLYAMYDYRDQMDALRDFLRALGALLVGTGFVGLYALLTIRRERWSKLATAGLAIVVLGAAGGIALLTQTSPGVAVYEPSGLETIFSAVAVLTYFGGPVGVLLLGVAALRTRGLGRWRWLPLALGLLGSPLSEEFLFRLYPVVSPGGFQEIHTALALAVLFHAPWLLIDTGYVLLGLLMPGPESQELLSREEENLSRARRLYEEAWGRGELGVLDELVASGVVDHYHRQRGRESFGRSVANLRGSFPDLRFVLEGQEAEEDRVTTRWTASGTDRGGVLWYPPTGRSATFSGTFTDRFEEGRLVEHRGEADTQGLLRRLGLPPKG